MKQSRSLTFSTAHIPGMHDHQNHRRRLRSDVRPWFKNIHLVRASSLADPSGSIARRDPDRCTRTIEPSRCADLDHPLFTSSNLASGSNASAYAEQRAAIRRRTHAADRRKALKAGFTLPLLRADDCGRHAWTAAAHRMGWGTWPGKADGASCAILFVRPAKERGSMASSFATC